MLATKPKKHSVNGSKARTHKEPWFEYVLLTPDLQSVVCKLDTGGPYVLPVAAFELAEDWDESGLASVRIDAKDKWTGWARQRSGVELDFPSDFVLHHCEPAYEHFGQKTSPVRIGARIRMLREAKGFTLVDLAKKTGIAQPNLTRLEQDRVNPSIQTLRRVAAALGVGWLALIAEKE